jgi:hypothetical protein
MPARLRTVVGSTPAMIYSANQHIQEHVTAMACNGKYYVYL